MIRMTFIGLLMFITLALAIDASPLHAATVTLAPIKDATIFGDSKNQGLQNTVGQNLSDHSNGAGPGIFSGGNGTLAPHRALIEFDVAKSVPAGAVITSAQLTLHIGIVAGSGGAPGLGDPSNRVMDLHRLTSDWGEGTTGEAATRISGTGQGFPANPGDATWDQPFFDKGAAWKNPGGDFDPNTSASLSVGRDFFTPQTWQSTPGLVKDVQGWLDKPTSNFGWILVNEDETGRQTHRAFYSKEADDPAFRPQLTLTYTTAAALAPAPVPVPAAVWLFGSGLAAVAGFAQRKKSQA